MFESGSAIVLKLFAKGISRVIDDLLKRRTEAARQILLSELAKGDAQLVDVADVDEVAAIVFEYMTQAQRGTARANLRLMAQVIQKQINYPPLYADNFLRWAGLLSSLSREEIIAVAAFHKMKRRHALLKAQNENAQLERCELDEIVGVGKCFTNDEELFRHISALTRTGLIIARSGWGALVYETTDLMDQLEKLVMIDAALQEPLR